MKNLCSVSRDGIFGLTWVTYLPAEERKLGMKNLGSVSRDGSLGLQFDKRFESFAPCFSQSLLLADFKEKHYLL
jgi:hypothetical protein